MGKEIKGFRPRKLFSPITYEFLSIADPSALKLYILTVLRTCASKIRKLYFLNWNSVRNKFEIIHEYTDKDINRERLRRVLSSAICDEKSSTGFEDIKCGNYTEPKILDFTSKYGKTDNDGIIRMKPGMILISNESSTFVPLDHPVEFPRTVHFDPRPSTLYWTPNFELDTCLNQGLKLNQNKTKSFKLYVESLKKLVLGQSGLFLTNQILILQTPPDFSQIEHPRHVLLNRECSCLYIT